MSDATTPRAGYKVWLETDEGVAFGPGVYRLLRKALETGTLKESAESLGMSYRFAWGLLRRAEERIGQPLVERHKGGRSGGGGVELTEVGHQFIEDFSHLEIIFDALLTESTLLDRLKPRREILAEVRDIEKSEKGSRMVLKLLDPHEVTLNIPSSSIDLSDIQTGDQVKVEIISLAESIEKTDA